MGVAEFPEADKILFSGKVCQQRLADATWKDAIRWLLTYYILDSVLVAFTSRCCVKLYTSDSLLDFFPLLSEFSSILLKNQTHKPVTILMEEEKSLPGQSSEAASIPWAAAPWRCPDESVVFYRCSRCTVLTRRVEGGRLSSQLSFTFMYFWLISYTESDPGCHPVGFWLVFCVEVSMMSGSDVNLVRLVVLPTPNLENDECCSGKVHSSFRAFFIFHPWIYFPSQYWICKVRCPSRFSLWLLMNCSNSLRHWFQDVG